MLFVIAIFLIGRQKNMFIRVYRLATTFYNVSGLQVGNNVRFSGINVGTVDNIQIINDSTVQVDMIIAKSVQKFIKEDSEASIGSSGIIGDRILIISQGSNDAAQAEDKQILLSTEPVETDEILASLKVTANQLSEIMVKVNSGNGTLGRLIQDSTIAENINQTIVNLKSSSRGLNENMNAAKENFLFKGYFNRKAKAAKAKKEADLKKVEDQKAVDKKKN
jgi:phospholipid/cholesterol/gamma-HCH transport system substrate-binding protein